MKALFLAAALAAAALPAMAQNVSISIGQPGFYGRIDMGDRGYYGPPPVYVAQPVIIERHHRVRAEPIYLRVPSSHRQNWRRYCGRYGACGQPVLFVQDRWYADVYAPRYRERHGHYDRYDRHDRHERHDKHDKHDKHGHGRGHDRHDDRGHGRGHDRHDDRGHGRGH